MNFKQWENRATNARISYSIISEDCAEHHPVHKTYKTGWFRQQTASQKRI